MHGIVILVGVAVLAAALGLFRGAPRGGLVRSAVAFVLGLSLTAAGVKAAGHALALYPDDELARFAAHALEHSDERPTILMWGTSMARNAIDDELVTETLTAAGYDVRVISVSLEGASVQERDLHLRQFLRAADSAPAAVLMEVSLRTDDRPTFVFDVSKFSARAIKQFGPRGTYWALRGFLSDWRPGLVQWGYQGALLGVHAGLNHLNVGYLRNARPLQDVTPSRAFDGLPGLRVETLTAEEVVAGLAENADSPMAPPRWARAFRADQRAMLTQAGVERVGYFMPPVVPADQRAYAAAVCAEEPQALCIAPDDAALSASLADIGFWADERHLTEIGAQTYSLWLAERLIEVGLVGEPLSGEPPVEPESPLLGPGPAMSAAEAQR